MMKSVLAILIAVIVAVVFVLPQVDLDPTIVKFSQLLWAFWIVALLATQQRSSLRTIHRIHAAFLSSSQVLHAKGSNTHSPTLLC